MKIEKEKKLKAVLHVLSETVYFFSRSIIDEGSNALVRQLAELCRGSMHMWRSLSEFQEVQNHVPQVGGPVNRLTNGESTSNFHRQIGDLESALSDWHSSFFLRIKFAREFIHSLHAWSKLPLPVNAEPPHPTPVSSNVFGFFDKWKTIYDGDLDTLACGAIENFISVVKKISRTQTEQLKKSKEIGKKFKEIEKKFKEIEKKSSAPSSMAGTDSRLDNSGHAEDPFAEEKSMLAAWQREVENERLRHTEEEKETRAKALEDIQKGLETVLQTLSDTFYGSMVKVLVTVCERSNNAEGVPEESGRGDVEAHEGGGGGESNNNNAEGVPEESGIGDVEAHGGGGDNSDNNYAEGSQRIVEEEILRHTKEEEEEEETRARPTTMMASFQRIVEEEMLRHPEAVAAAIPSFSVMNECMAF